MRHILSLWFSLALCLIPLSSNAENIQKLSVLCDTSKNVLTKLSNELNMEMKIIAQNHTNDGSDIYTTMWVGEKSDAWAIVATDKEAGESCLLVYGRGFIQYFVEGTPL